jgi:imidazolonepropionase-like amidohydrolase
VSILVKKTMSLWTRSLACLTLALTLLTTLSTTTEGADVFFADQLWSGDGSVLKDAAVLVVDGKVVAVGPRGTVEIPSGAMLHELGTVSLVPGLVMAETTFSERGRDEEEAITPYIRAVDGFDYFGEYDSLLSVGITTIQLSPGSARLMPGQSAVVKLAGDDPVERTLSNAESLRVLLTQAAFNPPRIYEPPVAAVSVERPLEPTRPQLAGNLGDAIAGLRALFLASGSDEASKDVVLSSIRNSLATGMPVRMTARSVGEIHAALQLSNSFQLPTILSDLDQVVALEDAITMNSDLLRGLVLEAGTSPGRFSAIAIPDPDSPELVEPWQRVQTVIDRGGLDRLAVTAGDSDLEQIWFLAASLLASDLTEQQLLNCLTSTPSKVLGVDGRVGTIAAGKDADFVVLSGEPFRSKTHVVATFIDGKKVYDRTATPQTKVISADSVYASTGLIQGGSVAVSGKFIRSVGSDISYPSDAEVLHFPGCVIVPGFVDMATTVGSGGTFSERPSLGDKLGELLVSDDDSVKLARQGGVTTGLLASTNLPSPVVAFKLGDVPRVLEDPVAIRFQVAGNLTSEEVKLKATLQAAKQYVDSWDQYDAAFAKYNEELAEYEKAKAKYDAAVEAAKKKEEEAKKKEEEEKKKAEESKDSGDAVKKDTEEPTEKKAGETKEDSKQEEPKKEEAAEKLTEPTKPKEPTKPRQTSALDPYRLLFGKKIVAIVEVGDAKSLELAVKLFVDEYKLPTTLAVDGTTHREAAKLAGKNVSVVVHPPMEVSEDGAKVNLAERFLTAGISTAIESRSGTGAKRLPSVISYAVFNGLGREDALKSLTSVPAGLLGLKSVGKIEASRDADLVVMTGSPFDASSRVVAVMIDGEWVYRSDVGQGTNRSRGNE